MKHRPPSSPRGPALGALVLTIAAVGLAVAAPASAGVGDEAAAIPTVADLEQTAAATEPATSLAVVAAIDAAGETPAPHGAPTAKVPEPGSMIRLTLGLGGAGLWGLRRRRALRAEMDRAV